MAIWLRFKAYIIGLVAVFTAALSIYLIGRSHGGQAESEARDESDRKQARKIEDSADTARTITGDPVKRLRDKGRIRN
jgi:hypothetical protein